MSNYKFLDKINFPSDIKKLSNKDLKILSEEIRAKMIEACLLYTSPSPRD